jgi:hypothetical protein
MEDWIFGLKENFFWRLCSTQKTEQEKYHVEIKEIQRGGSKEKIQSMGIGVDGECTTKEKLG